MLIRLDANRQKCVLLKFLLELVDDKGKVSADMRGRYSASRRIRETVLYIRAITVSFRLPTYGAFADARSGGDELFGLAGGGAGVRGKSISAHFVCKVLRNGGAADHHLDLVTQARLF